MPAVPPVLPPIPSISSLPIKSPAFLSSSYLTPGAPKKSTGPEYSLHPVSIPTVTFFDQRFDPFSPSLPHFYRIFIFMMSFRALLLR